MSAENPNKFDPLRFGLLAFESAMAVFYVIACVLLLFSSFFKRIDGELRIALGIVVGIYGIFRIWRAVKKLRN